MSTRWQRNAILFVVAVAAWPTTAFAYVGPGAGFALVSSFLTLVVAFAAAFFAFLALPLRAAVRARRRRQSLRRARVKKVIVLGLDGLEPDICDDMLARGELPHLARLRDSGTYGRLGTSMPALSPVAWSTFATGCDPSRHGVFDFIARDPRTYAAKLSSSEVYGRSRFARVGPFTIPLARAGVRNLRRSRTFWSVLSEHGVFSSVLRVPITFPVEKIDGVMVAGMCVPDMRGSQGSFTFITSEPSRGTHSGVTATVARSGGEVEIPGPPSPVDGKTLTARVAIRRVGGKRNTKERFELASGTQRVELNAGHYTPWVRLNFHAAPGLNLSGIARFLPTTLNGSIDVYVTPIQIDPERPAMPVSHPPVFSIYLSKLLGSFGTLGLLEDTTALNEGVIDEAGFLDQAYLYHDERRAMWFHTLDRLRSGLAVCVFDISDRLQHMFFRYLEPSHPANAGRDVARHAGAVAEMYRRMDALVGETMRYVDKDTALFVISDHGFKTFRRGVNLNAWLEREGLLVTRDGASPGEYLSAIDWTRTRAYALGLGGIFINQRGRERHGIVEPADVAPLKRRISEGLMALEDDGTKCIRRVVDVAAEWSGPYRDGGPDLLPGYEVGYRVSWDCAKGCVRPELFEDNTKCWSGDHCMDADLVPGVMFTNLSLATEGARLMDVGPTVLDLFGVEVPAFMSGRTLVKR